MLNFFVKCLLVASWIVALGLSALTVEERSSWTPLTSDAVVEVTEWSGEQRVTDLRRNLSALAATEGVIIGQIEPDVHDNRGSRIIYLTGPGAEEIIADPPQVDFGSTMSTSFAPMSEIEYQDPVGDWVILGRQEVVSELAEGLRLQGAVVELAQSNRWPVLQRPRALEIAVGAMLAAATGALVMSQTKRMAICRLHGGSFPEAACRVVGPLALVWAVSGGGALLAGGTWLVAAHGGIGLWEWVAHSVCVALGLWASAVLGGLLMLAVVWNAELVRSLKGELRAGAVIVASWSMRLGAMVLALGAIAQCLSLAGAAAARDRSLEAMKAIPGAHLLFIGGALYSNEAQTRMGEVLGPWLAKHAEAGRVMLADLQDGPGGQQLYVNRRYLDAHPLFLADGRDVRDVAGSDEVVVLIPESMWGGRDFLIPELREQAELLDGNRGDISFIPFMVRGDQRVPLFGIPDEANGPSGGVVLPGGAWADDPIVLVAPDNLYRGYVGAASRGRAFFFDADALIQEVEADPVLGGYVTSVTPVEVRAAHHAAEALVVFRLAVVEAGISVIVALLAGLALAVSHGQLRGQRIFVRYLHGRSALGAYKALLIAEAVLAFGVLGWIPWQVMKRRAHFDDLAGVTGGLGLGPPPELRLADVLPGLLVVLTVSGGMLVTLWSVHGRIIRKGVSEA